MTLYDTLLLTNTILSDSPASYIWALPRGREQRLSAGNLQHELEFEMHLPNSDLVGVEIGKGDAGSAGIVRVEI